MGIFKRLESSRHEQLVFTYLHEPDLRAIIAIHDTTLGPALGGVRMYPYATEEEALEDVLNLAQSMTYKAAAAGLNLGGGKAVIIGDPKTDKSEFLFRAFGKAVDSLGGRYITAEDVGTDVMDMEYISQETSYVTGVEMDRGGSGDPSPLTAYGVLQGMKASLEQVYGSQSFEGRSVAIQGVGNVGFNLVRLLCDEGAHIIIADIDGERVERTLDQFPGVEAVDVDEILEVDCDIFAPCAMGKVICAHNIETLRCKIIAGGANNQLEDVELGEDLADRGILYAPDYVINAGGLINVYLEFEGYSQTRAKRLIRGIFHNTLRIFRMAEDLGFSTAQAADRMAVQRMHEMARLSACFNRFPRAQNAPFNHANRKG